MKLSLSSSSLNPHMQAGVSLEEALKAFKAGGFSLQKIGACVKIQSMEYYGGLAARRIYGGRR